MDTTKVASVASDIMGVSARAMLDEIVGGQTDAELMADLARGRMRSKIPELEKALTGIVQLHHRFVLTQQLEHIDFLDAKIEAISATLPYGVNRWANVILPVVFFAFNLIGLPTYPSLYDRFLIVVGLLFNVLTVWHTWRWAEQERVAATPTTR